MLRSSQMLVVQALIVHRFGRSWRLNVNKQFDKNCIEILHAFGDSVESAFSIHKLLEAGKGYGLSAGSWVGPYAMCRVWETLARNEKEETNKALPFAVYIVFGDEDGERGGAPVVYIGLFVIIFAFGSILAGSSITYRNTDTYTYVVQIS